jgi:hypothetical protein
VVEESCLAVAGAVPSLRRSAGAARSLRCIPRGDACRSGDPARRRVAVARNEGRMPTLAESPHTPTPPQASAVWSLLLPAAEHVLCHASAVPEVARELATRGARVDLVSRCDLQAWTARPLPGESRCLWEPDPDADYDLALAWDPPSALAVRGWVDAVASHPAPPREVAVWSRNPLHRNGVPPWWRIDGWLEQAGFRPGQTYVGLPEPERVRQLIAWDDWARTPLVRHRRSHRAWKAWVTRRSAWRWMQPARLRRASLSPVTPAPSRLDTVLAAAATAVGAPLSVERLLASANGVAIVVVRILRADAPRRAVLKIPYAIAAAPRVLRNAAALEWAAQVTAHEALAAGGTLATGGAPRLLARGESVGAPWTLEDWLAGSDAQGWDDAARDRVCLALGDVLSAWRAMGEPARPLDDAMLERACGAPIRAASALLPRELAERLHAARARLYDSLRGVPVPLVPRHGDFKLENVFGDAADPQSWRLLDWELWTPRGLPLLDALHLVASRRARDAGCAMGTAVRRWILPAAFGSVERQFLERAASGLDARYVEAAPLLYWLDRIGPIAERGVWPQPGWEQANVAAVLAALPVQGGAEVGA